MDHPIVLTCINEYLTLKSCARLRAVCKNAKEIILYRNKWYPLFKNLKINSEKIVKMILNSDPVWMYYYLNFEEYSCIYDHKYSSEICDYIETFYRNCIEDFDLIYDKWLENNGTNVSNLVRIHCRFYTNFNILQEILTELIVDEYDLTI